MFLNCLFQTTDLKDDLRVLLDVSEKWSNLLEVPFHHPWVHRGFEREKEDRNLENLKWNLTKFGFFHTPQPFFWIRGV